MLVRVKEELNLDVVSYGSYSARVLSELFQLALASYSSTWRSRSFATWECGR